MVQWLEKRTPAIKVGASNAQPRDALRTELWPVSLGLRVVGAMPISTDRRTGEHVFRVASAAHALSVLEYVAIVVALCFVHSENLNAILHTRFDVAISKMLMVLYDVLVVVTPWFYWMEARALARHLNEWTRLQVEFEQVTRTRLHLGLRRRATVLTCALCVISVPLEVLYAYLDGATTPLAGITTSVFQDLLRGLLCARWHLQCMALVSVSRQALEELKMEITRAHSVRVLQYHLLWLRLSAQARDMGSVCCYTHGFYLIYLFVTLMLAVYQAATGAISIEDIPINVLEGAIIAASLFVFCDSAHRATAHVGNEWLAYLLLVRASQRRDLREQFGDFLETCTAQVPVITLGAYVVVNRALLVSMTSAMITYLVVLVQFKMASGGADDISKYSTNATDLKTA